MNSLVIILQLIAKGSKSQSQQMIMMHLNRYINHTQLIQLTYKNFTIKKLDKQFKTNHNKDHTFYTQQIANQNTQLTLTYLLLITIQINNKVKIKYKLRQSTNHYCFFIVIIIIIKVIVRNLVYLMTVSFVKGFVIWFLLVEFTFQDSNHYFTDGGNTVHLQYKYESTAKIINQTGNQIYKTFIQPFNPYTDFDEPIGKYIYQYLLLKLFNRKNAKNQDFVAALNNIGHAYGSQGRHESSFKFFSIALFKIEKNRENKDLLSYAQTLENIGNSYFYKGISAKALYYNKRVLKIKKQVYGQNHQSYAKSLHKKGEIFFKMRKVDLSLELEMKSLNIRKFNLKQNHSDIAQSLLSIGYIYITKGQYDQGLKYLYEALQIIRYQYGQHNPIFAQILLNIGKGYIDKGIFDTALNYILNASQIIKLCLNQNHQLYSSALNILGILFDIMDVPQTAQIYYQRSIQIVRKQQFVNKIQLSARLNNIGWLYFTLKNYNKSFQYFMQGLLILDQNQDQNDIIYSKLYGNLGSLLNRWGRHDDSLQYLFKSLYINKKIFGELNPENALTLLNIGVTYFSKKMYIEANNCYSIAQNIYKIFKLQLHLYYKILIDNIRQNSKQYELHSLNRFHSLQFQEIVQSIFYLNKLKYLSANDNGNNQTANTKKELISLKKAIQNKSQS